LFCQLTFRHISPSWNFVGRWATVSFPETCLSTCTPCHPVICQERQASTFQGLLLRAVVRICTRGGGVLNTLLSSYLSGAAGQYFSRPALAGCGPYLYSRWGRSDRELVEHKSSACTAQQKQRKDANVHSRLEVVSNWRHTSLMSRRGLANLEHRRAT